MKHKLSVYNRRLKQIQLSGRKQNPVEIAELPQNHCLNCGNDYKGNFCPVCGQTAKTERFTISTTLKHLLFFFTKFDDKFKHTVIDLCYRPGHMIREYIDGRRTDYLRPLQMLVCMITIYALIVYLILPETDTSSLIDIRGENGEDMVVKALGNHPVLLTCYNLLQSIMNNRIASALGLIVLYVAPTWLCFRKTEIGSRFNLAEHFFARVFITCQSMIVSFLLLPYAAFTGDQSPMYSLNFILVVWVYKQLFRISWWRSFKLTALSSLLMWTILVMLLSTIIVILFTVGGINPPET